MKKYIIICFILLVFNNSFAEDKIFIREYRYRAGENDSKLTSRQKAVEQAKILLLEELGTYLESWANYNVSDDEKNVESLYQREIKTLSAGVTETKILEERWNGEEYYVKAQIKADPNEVVKKINQTLLTRRSNFVIDSLTQLLTSTKNDAENIERIKIRLNGQNEQLKIQLKNLQESHTENEYPTAITRKEINNTNNNTNSSSTNSSSDDEYEEVRTPHPNNPTLIRVTLRKKQK